MHKLVCCLVFTCACALAQNAPSASDNAALDALKQRVLRMNLLNPPSMRKAGPQQVILSGPVTTKVCSIPLLEVKPPGTADKIPTTQPREPVRKGDTVQVPAPPCGAGAFTNRK